jgi:hypothetical protein
VASLGEPLLFHSLISVPRPERGGRQFLARLRDPPPRCRLLVACRCGVPPCRFRGCLDRAASAAAWPRRGRFRVSYSFHIAPLVLLVYYYILLDIEFACSVEPMRSGLERFLKSARTSAFLVNGSTSSQCSVGACSTLPVNSARQGICRC